MPIKQQKDNLIVSITDQDKSITNWYQAHQEPVVGTNLIIEVELTDEDSEEEIQDIKIEPAQQ